MARATWSGAVEFAGFPINVKLFSRVKSRSSQSFKTLAPNGAPVKQVLVDSDGQTVERDDCSKGVEISKGTFHALPPEAVEMIGSVERSVTLKIGYFAPAATVPLHASLGSYAVRPDEKIAGSEKPLNILWNGLRKTGEALVTEITPRAGARDSILVITATDEGLQANMLPYVKELATDIPAWEPTVDEEAAGVFETFVASMYESRDFDHAALKSSYTTRREEAIQAAIKGEKIEVPEVAKAQEAVPDLMAAMQASLKANKLQSKPKKKAKVAA